MGDEVKEMLSRYLQDMKDRGDSTAKKLLELIDWEEV